MTPRCELSSSFHILTLGDDNTCLLWTDQCLAEQSISEIVMFVLALVSRHRQRARSVTEGLHDHAWILDIWGALGPTDTVECVALRQVVLSPQPDSLRWPGLPMRPRLHDLATRPCSPDPFLAALAAHLADLGAPTNPFLRLACQSGPLLDGRTPGQAWAPTRRQMCAL